MTCNGLRLRPCRLFPDRKLIASIRLYRVATIPFPRKGKGVYMDVKTERHHKSGRKIANVIVNPDLHLSESTARIKVERFLRNALDEIDECNRIGKEVRKRIDARYRKRIPRFRALCQHPRFSSLMLIINDTSKKISGLELTHFHHPETTWAYFGLSPFEVTNKQLLKLPAGFPPTIAISAHTLARMLERCSTSLLLDMSGIRLLLVKLLAAALAAEFDETGRCRLGLDQFPDMIFVCCKDRWRYDEREIRARYTIVTYFEK